MTFSSIFLDVDFHIKMRAHVLPNADAKCDTQILYSASVTGDIGCSKDKVTWFIHTFYKLIVYLRIKTPWQNGYGYL